MKCDVCKQTKLSTKKYGKFHAKLTEEIPWNKLCVYIIYPYKIRIKGVTMVDPVTGWFEITQYNNKKPMMIVNLIETTWLVGYPWPV